MNPVLALLRLYTPTWLKRRQLAELFECTAAAFGAEVPSLAGLSFDACLEEYARFTATWAEDALQSSEDLAGLRCRLYQNARQLGRELRGRLRVSSADEAMAAARLLYRGLRIEMRGPVRGEIEVRRCFFSRHYSSQACHVVSALDAGVVAGLSNGWQLRFHERITEGHDRCRASLVLLQGEGPAMSPPGDLAPNVPAVLVLLQGEGPAMSPGLSSFGQGLRGTTAKRRPETAQEGSAR